MLKSITILFFIFFFTTLQAQKKGLLEKRRIDIVKNGPYFGLQKGKFIVVGIGGERQWKDFQFRKPKTHALNIGFNYDFSNKNLVPKIEKRHGIGEFVENNQIYLKVFYKTFVFLNKAFTLFPF